MGIAPFIGQILVQMGTMGLQYIFSFFNPLKNGDDGINTINGEEKNITDCPVSTMVLNKK